MKTGTVGYMYKRNYRARSAGFDDLIGVKDNTRVLKSYFGYNLEKLEVFKR